MYFKFAQTYYKGIIMELKNLITNNKTIKTEHPGLEGFVVEVSFISREKTKKLIEKATTTSFNKKTHQPEESLDSELFMELYTKALIKGWTGLKLGYLKELLPVELGDMELEEEIEYTEKNALDLRQNATDFDTWLSSVVGDIRNFNKSS